jgi:hypothetical protein
MPIPPEIAIDKIGTPQKGHVEVFVGPCSIQLFQEEKIPTDGRKYKVDGTIHFKCGVSLPARFTIDTTGFDFIVLPSVIVYHDGLWYHCDEEELAQALGRKGDELLPFTWSPDRELDFWCPAPYPMKFDPKYMEEQWTKSPKWWEQKSGDEPNA